MQRIPYRREIDGLRAIAVIGVLLYHADLGLRSGLVGVDVFFVISGYLITSLLLTEWRMVGRIDLAGFYARRVRRLLPALALVCMLTLAAASAVLPPLGAIRDVGNSCAAALLFVGNLFFESRTGGYFDPAAGHFPLLHTWSLGVEEQFYLVWPAGLLLLLRLRPSALPVAIAGCGVASLALCLYLAYFHPIAAFYQMPARFWELAVGGLIASVPRLPSIFARGIALAGLIAVLASFFFTATDFPSLPAALAVIGTALILFAVHRSPDLGVAGNLLGSTPLVGVGLISYSLYLWHWPLLVLVGASQVEPLSAVVRTGLCLAAVALGWASYRFFETPLRKPDDSVSARKLVGTALLASAALAFASMQWGNFLHRDPPRDDLASRTEADMPANRMDCNYRGDEAIDVLPRSACKVGDGPVKVAIWGDSHALAWSPFAWAIARQRQVAATSYSRDACPPAVGYANGKRQLEESRCRDFNDQVVRQIVDLDVLVMTASWPMGSANVSLEEHLQRTLEQVSPHARTIILLGPTPIFPKPVPDCVRLNELAACAIRRADFDAQTRSSRTFLRSLAQRFDNVEYVDLADFFCDATICAPLKDGYGVAWDKDHVSASAAVAFAREYLARPGSARR